MIEMHQLLINQRLKYGSLLNRIDYASSLNLHKTLACECVVVPCLNMSKQDLILSPPFSASKIEANSFCKGAIVAADLKALGAWHTFVLCVCVCAKRKKIRFLIHHR